MESAPSTSRTLTDSIALSDTKDVLRGGVDAAIADFLSAPTAKQYAAAIVDTACFDTPDALREMTDSDMKEIGIPCGRRARVCRAIFAGQVIVPAGAAVPPPAPPPVNVTVSAAAPAPRQWKLEWPDDAPP